MRHGLLTVIVAALAFSAVSSAREVDGLIIGAVQKYENGELSSAAAELYRISKQYPDNDAAFYYLGMCDIAQGDNIAAEKHLRQAWQLDSTNLWYGHALAEVCMARKEYDEAFPIMCRLISENPATFANPYTLSIVAEMESERGHYLSAISLYEQALALDPTYYLARLGKSEALRKSGDENGYLAEIESLMYDAELSDQTKASYLSMSLGATDETFRQKWEEKIIGIVENCEARFPDKCAYHLLRLELADFNDTELVVRECEAALLCPDLDSDRMLFCLSLMGDSKYQSGDRSGAYKAYDRALKINSRYLPVLNNYAYFLSEERRSLKKALKMSEITVTDEPNNPIYLDTYGWILHRLGRNEDAEKYLNRALVAGGRESKVILEHFADILDALGKTSVANFYRDLSKQQKQ